MGKNLRDSGRAVNLRKKREIELFRMLAKMNKQSPLSISQLQTYYPKASQRTLYNRNVISLDKESHNTIQGIDEIYRYE